MLSLHAHRKYVEYAVVQVPTTVLNGKVPILGRQSVEHLKILKYLNLIKYTKPQNFKYGTAVEWVSKLGQSWLVLLKSLYCKEYTCCVCPLLALREGPVTVAQGMPQWLIFTYYISLFWAPYVCRICTKIALVLIITLIKNSSNTILTMVVLFPQHE